MRTKGSLVSPSADLTMEVDFSAHDLSRFLAKVGLGWAIATLGIDAFAEIYVRDLILGVPCPANRWVGGCAVRPKFDSRSLHVAQEASVGSDAVVYIQLFRPPLGWDEPPVYQVVVGRLRT